MGRGSPRPTGLILAIFDDFYSLLCEYPYRAKCAFELHGSACLDPHQQGAPGTVQPLHRGARTEGARRIPRAGQRSCSVGRGRSAVRCDDRRSLRGGHRLQLRTLVAPQYLPGVWRPVAYSFPPPSKLRAFSMASVHRRLPSWRRVDAELIAVVPCECPGFSVPFRDLEATRKRIVERVDAASVRIRRVAPPGGARCGRGGLLSRPQRLHRGPLGAERRQHRAVRRGAAQQRPRASTPTPCCTGSRTFTTCSARRLPIFTSRPGSIIKPACFSTASCRGGRWGTTIRRSASITSARSRF